MANTAHVALVKGDDRYGNIARALELIADQIDLRGKQRILIKPNFVTIGRPLAATHVDAVRAVLDFLRPRTSARITIGEGAALGDTLDGYRLYGYTGLAKDYDVDLVDLNRGEWVEAPVYDNRFKDIHLRVSKTVVESDLRISVGPPKTHDTVIVTLSLKNMVMGSLIRDQRSGGGAGPVMHALKGLAAIVPSQVKNTSFMSPLKTSVMRAMMHSDKAAMHMGYAIMNLNLYRLAPLVYPHLAVIDGFVGMEGAGPTRGDAVDLRCAVASSDFLAADTVAAALMGFGVDEVGYLYYCKLKGLGVGDLGQIAILGNTVVDCRRAFRPPPDVDAQRKWKIANVERFL
jgi:uncharacterized protein (DUF362 family)